MTLSLDHIVIAVADLDAAFADYATLGFRTIRGGEHANGITHNVLVVLEDGAYLELIAWKRPEPGTRWSDVYHRAGEGLVDYALLPGDIAAVVTAAQARGLDIGEPEFGGRNRPDGERLEWRTARSLKPDVPFLCGDVTPRRLRVPEGAVRHQPNGVTGVAAVTVAVQSLETSLERYAALVGSTGSIGVGAVAGAPARRAAVTLGNGTVVTLAEPTGAGPLADHLAARGESPFSIAFNGSHARELDGALSHGARLSVIEGAAL